MPLNLHGRNFLKELDFTPDELRHLIQLSSTLKAAKAGGYERPALVGRNIALIFEKSSTRTRCAFEVAAHDQGAHVTYLDPSGSQLGKQASQRDRLLLPRRCPQQHRAVAAGDRRDARHGRPHRCAEVAVARCPTPREGGRDRRVDRGADHDHRAGRRGGPRRGLPLHRRVGLDG